MGSGPFTVSLEKHLRKEKYAQNNAESHSGRNEVDHVPILSACALFPFGAGTPERRLQAQEFHWPHRGPRPTGVVGSGNSPPAAEPSFSGPAAVLKSVS